MHWRTSQSSLPGCADARLALGQVVHNSEAKVRVHCLIACHRIHAEPLLVCHKPVLQSFGEMSGQDRLGTREIRDGARHAIDSMEGTSRQLQPLGGALQQLTAGRIQRGDSLEFGAGESRVHARAYWPRSLTCARRDHPGAYGGRGFSGSSLRQLSNRHGLNFNDKVQAISQRP